MRCDKLWLRLLVPQPHCYDRYKMARKGATTHKRNANFTLFGHVHPTKRPFDLINVRNKRRIMAQSLCSVKILILQILIIEKKKKSSQDVFSFFWECYKNISSAAALIFLRHQPHSINTHKNTQSKSWKLLAGKRQRSKQQKARRKNKTSIVVERNLISYEDEDEFSLCIK